MHYTLYTVPRITNHNIIYLLLCEMLNIYLFIVCFVNVHQFIYLLSACEYASIYFFIVCFVNTCLLSGKIHCYTYISHFMYLWWHSYVNTVMIKKRASRLIISNWQMKKESSKLWTFPTLKSKTIDFFRLNPSIDSSSLRKSPHELLPEKNPAKQPLCCLLWGSWHVLH